MNLEERIKELVKKEHEHIEMFCAAFIKMCPDISPMDVELVQEKILHPTGNIEYKWYFQRRIKE